MQYHAGRFRWIAEGEIFVYIIFALVAVGYGFYKEAKDKNKSPGSN
jgi:hypothetical protein